jgi:HEAT repeat protein
MGQNSQQNEIIKRLQVEDADERRLTVEELISSELTDDIVKVLVQMIKDPDKGVRDSLSFTLSYNGHPSIPKYLTPFISSEDIAIRNLAGDILLKIGPPAVDALLDYLPKGSDDDKKFIIDLLGLIGDSRASQPIYEILKTTENDNVKLACIEAWGNIKSKEYINILYEMYKENELFKPTIIETFGKIGEPSTLDFMIEIFENEDDITKFSIIESLGIIGNEKTFFFLLNELLKNKGPINWPIISSLRQIKERYNLEIPYDESLKKIFLSTFEEADLKYKKDAAYLLRMFGDIDTLTAFIKYIGLDYEIDETIKHKLIENAEIIYPKLVELIGEQPSNLLSLLNLCKELNDNTQKSAYEKLTDLEKQNFCNNLSNCLKNTDEEIRRVSMELLFELNEEFALLFVDIMLNDENMWNRYKLAEILEKMPFEKTKNILTLMLKDSEEMISQKAKEILDSNEKK